MNRLPILSREVRGERMENQNPFKGTIDRRYMDENPIKGTVTLIVFYRELF